MKKKILGGALIAVAAAAGLAFGLNGGSEQDEETIVTSMDPEKIYLQRCSMCHGDNLEGFGNNFPSLETIGSSLTQEEIEDIIVNGKGNMDAGLLKGETVMLVAEWLAAKK